MPTIHNPASIAKPASTYSHGVEVSPGARLLYIAGQVGVTKDGRTADGFEAQAETCWNNIKAILASAGMGIEDVVKVTTFITQREDIPTVRIVRDRHVAVPPPASTLLVVQGLANSAWLIEIEAVAAKT